MGNRASSLPIAQYCGQSARLGRLYNASGMAALQSSCWHARTAGDCEWEAMYERLPSKMRNELDNWPDMKWPEHLGAPDRMEFELELDKDAGVLGQTISTGHADMLWTYTTGSAIVHVGDAKRTRFTAELDSLQLDFYGWAWATLVDADAYMAGLYIIEDGHWVWRDEPVYLASLEGAEIARRLVAAMTNEKTVIGSHCAKCYSAQHCPEYMLPVIDGLEFHGDAGGLNALDEGMDASTAPSVIRLRDSAKKLAALADTRLRAYVHEHGHIVEGDMQWGPSGSGHRWTRRSNGS